MANGYKGFDSSAWERVLSSTLADHIRKVEDAATRNFQFGALLENQGRVSYNHGGQGLDWPVDYRFHTAEGNTGQTAHNFAQKNLTKQANLEYRGYQVTDAMYRREFEANKGEAAIIKNYERFLQKLESSMKNALGPAYWADGSSSATDWHGVNTLFQTADPAETITITSGAARTANDADVVANPTGTYAGLSVDLGSYGGDNESGEVWPQGVADSEYDFWTPLIVAYNHSGFSGSGTFITDGDEALRYGIINSQRNMSTTGGMSNIWLARNLYNDFLNNIDAKERIPITGENSLRALGFRNVVQFDGLEVSWEAAIPSSVGFGCNMQCVELRAMFDTLLESEGPEYDIDSQAFKAVVHTLSNLKFDSPRNFCKWIDATP